MLAADAVQKVGNGHPGTAISLAPVAYLLYQKVMNVDPADDRWLGRDIFVLSAGHSSLTPVSYTHLDVYKRQKPQNVKKMCVSTPSPSAALALSLIHI